MTQLTQTAKLGGSLMNWIYGNNATVPVVGKGATIMHYSDRSAYEVIEVSEDGLKVVIQRYNAERTDKDGMTDQQSYKYEKLLDSKSNIQYRFGAWYSVIDEIVFTKQFNQWIDENNTEFWKNDELRAELWVDGDLQLIAGKTKKKKKYNKINIVFGIKREFYDYTR